MLHYLAELFTELFIKDESGLRGFVMTIRCWNGDEWVSLSNVWQDQYRPILWKTPILSDPGPLALDFSLACLTASPSIIPCT